MAEMKDGDKMLMSCIRGEFNNLPHAERIRIGDFMDLESVSELLREREHAMAAVRRIECRIARVMDAIGKRRAAGVPALPTPKLCPGCAQYHGRNDCPVGWLAPAEPYGVPASEYLAKIEADPRRAAALQRARDRAPGVEGTDETKGGA